MKLIPDAQFAKFERASGFDINNDGTIGGGVQCESTRPDNNDETVITITINKKKV